MFSVRHLQHRREELQEQYDALSEKIKRLRLDSVIQAGTSIAFQLEKEIEQAEAKRTSLVEEIDSLEKSSEIRCIRNALFRLNYIKQVGLFKQFREKERRIGAFLVHGLPEHGQIFLLKRLLDPIADISVTPPIHFDVSSRTFKPKVEYLWRQLARDMEIHNPSQEQVIKGIVARLQNQHVILVFNYLDSLYQDYLQQLISDFWLPLVNSIQQPIHTNNKYFLLMFLVDHDGCVSTWYDRFADTVDSVWEPCTPIRLPIIDRLSDEILTGWIENAINELPHKLIQAEIDYTVNLILEKSEGIPERVFGEIVNLCGCDWAKGEKLWSEL